MSNLRKLDASETLVEEIPLSVHYLKRLRLLSVHRCPLSSQRRGFLFTNLDILSDGIKELDLSYCNLSVVPDGIGLLHRLINLDLSGNDFICLPASISLLSNLRMLCLNNCKRLQLLPKLSVVNEDTLYGLQIQFNYIISKQEIDVSKFHARSITSPTVICLNCPKLAEKERGIFVAQDMLNSYLQLYTKYWIAPEAVFEIIGAGSEIPPGFKLLKLDEKFQVEGPWVGVAICAVIVGHHSAAYMEAKNTVTAHIRVGETYRKISVPVNLFVTGLETQLVFYSTVFDDLKRIVVTSEFD
ncbi:disease resistance-like protein DSC1 [Rutidosis leptorrhynchoides]|uniref:disease resistance-like protein DSC1 n=1 Tax=Rutidosis leptorrhynchoides TaxID=125765 RepID=UPI003A996B3D